MSLDELDDYNQPFTCLHIYVLLTSSLEGMITYRNVMT